MSETFYRYEIEIDGTVEDPDDPWNFGTDLTVCLVEFKVIKRTRCGAWLEIGSIKKWTNTVGRKRYAHETKEAALEAFVARRRKQRSILRQQLNVCETALDVATKKADELLQNGIARTRFEEKTS